MFEGHPADSTHSEYFTFSPVLQEMVQTAGEDEQEAAAEAAEAFLAEELPEATFGAAKAGSGMWASCLRVMHPTEVGGLWVTMVTHQLTSLVVSCRVALWTWCSLSKTKQPSGNALACFVPAASSPSSTLPHPVSQSAPLPLAAMWSGMLW